MKEDKKVSWEDIAWSNMYSIGSAKISANFQNYFLILRCYQMHSN